MKPDEVLHGEPGPAGWRSPAGWPSPAASQLYSSLAGSSPASQRAAGKSLEAMRGPPHAQGHRNPAGAPLGIYT